MSVFSLPFFTDERVAIEKLEGIILNPAVGFKRRRSIRVFVNPWLWPRWSEFAVVAQVGVRGGTSSVPR